MYISDLRMNAGSVTYNQLLAIDEVNEIIGRAGAKERFLAQAADLFTKHGVHDRVGLSLLHKHNDLYPGEHMVQIETVLDGERVLVTRPVARQPKPGKEVPWVWTHQDGTFQAIEFTEDAVASEVSQSAALPDAFVDEFLELAQASEVGAFFGLAIIHRDLLSKARSDQVAVEQSDPSVRANIVTLRAVTHGLKTIETAWTFDLFESGEAGRLTSSTCAATCRYECIVDYGTHSRLHFDHHVVQNISS